MVRSQRWMGLCGIVLPLLAMTSTVSAGTKIETRCQKNLGDGRILVVDDRVLPAEDSTFKVLAFRSESKDGDWAEGPCTIKVTGHAR